MNKIKLWGSRAALVLGILSIIAGVGAPGTDTSLAVAGIYMILGSIAYASAKKTRYGTVAATTGRRVMELVLLAVIVILTIFTKESDLVNDPVPNLIIPLWAIIAYVVIVIPGKKSASLQEKNLGIASLENGNRRVMLFVILALLVIGGVVAFTIFHNGSSNQDILSLKENCRSVGESIYQREEYQNMAARIVTGAPEYTYNDSLKTCLYYNSGVSSDGGLTEVVEDSLTGKQLVTYIESAGRPFTSCATCVASKAEFDQRKQALFQN